MRRVLVLALLAGCGTTESVPLLTPLDPSFPGRPTIRWRIAGRSVLSRPIYAAEFGDGSDVTLIIGGFHGNEISAIRVALELSERLERSSPLLRGHRVVLVPILNPDGYLARTRQNHRGVDLNRNLPTRNWGDRTLRKRDYPGPTPASEPETRAAMALVHRYRPAKLISIHSPLRMNNYDGPAGEPLARVMADQNGYPVRGDVGYPTPGSFGTWAGKEMGIPMVTLEVDIGRGAWNANRRALLAAIRFDPRAGK